MTRNRYQIFCSQECGLDWKDDFRKMAHDFYKEHIKGEHIKEDKRNTWDRKRG